MVVVGGIVKSRLRVQSDELVGKKVYEQIRDAGVRSLESFDHARKKRKKENETTRAIVHKELKP